MDDADKLPPDLAWQADGHVTDIVLTSVADGETGIVPNDALSHFDHCEDCAARLGAEALLSAHAGDILEALAEPMPIRAAARLPQPMGLVEENSVKTHEPTLAALPKRAIVGALLLAGVGAAPGLVHSIARLPAFLGEARRVLLLLVHCGQLVVKSDVGTGLAWAATLVLLVSGLVISRLSRPRSSDGLAREGGV